LRCVDDVELVPCPGLPTPWFTTSCPKGWLVFVLRFSQCEQLEGECSTDSEQCLTDAQEYLVVWDGSDWVRPADDTSGAFTFEERDNMDGTFSYRLTSLSINEAIYEFDEGTGQLEKTGGGECCITDWSIEMIQARRIWDADTVEDVVLTGDISGVVATAVPPTPGTCDALYGGGYGCAAKNTQTTGVPFYAAYGLPIDGYYLNVSFQTLTAAPAGDEGGNCTVYDYECGVDASTYTCGSSANNYYACQISTYGDGSQALGYYLGSLTLPVCASCVIGAETQPAYYCCNYAVQHYGIGGSTSAAVAYINCADTETTTLDEVTAGEWVQNPSVVPGEKCDYTNAVITFAE